MTNNQIRLREFIEVMTLWCLKQTLNWLKNIKKHDNQKIKDKYNERVYGKSKAK